MFDRFAWERAVLGSDLPPPARLLALTMATYADGETGRAWPSWATLARATGLSRRTVSRHLATLRTAGWLGDCGPRKGRPGHEVRVYRCQTPRGVRVTRVGCQSDTGGVSERHPEQPIEQTKEQHLSIHGMDDTAAAAAPTPGETMSTDEQPPLLRAVEAPGPSGEDQQPQGSPTPTPAPQKARAPFKSHREAESWEKVASLWQQLASGSLRPCRRIRPDRGQGHHLLRVLRVLGEPDVLRSVLWMTCSAESYYLRDSDNPRGFDTLWNQRKSYPENAEDWMERDHRACVLAATHGVPLPEGMPVVHEQPRPAIDMAARARARAEAHAARLRAMQDARGGDE